MISLSDSVSISIPRESLKNSRTVFFTILDMGSLEYIRIESQPVRQVPMRRSIISLPTIVESIETIDLSEFCDIGEIFKSPDCISCRLTTSPFVRLCCSTQLLGSDTMTVEPPVTWSFRNVESWFISWPPTLKSRGHIDTYFTSIVNIVIYSSIL